MKKIVAVVGATGAQGGSLVRAILNDPSGEFTPRAITRDVRSEKAKALAASGVEVVAANIDDQDSVAQAFRGAYGAFCVTFFWEHFSPEKETVQGRNLALAAKTAGIKHAIWSTFEDTRRDVPLSDNRMPTLQGKYKVPHFDSKGEVDQVFRDAHVPTTFLYTSWYYENLIFFGSQPTKNPDGTYSFTLPMGDKKLPGISSEDIGKCAYGIFTRGAELIGRNVGIAAEHLSGAEIAAALSKALGKTVRHNDITPEAFRALGFPGAEDVGNMYQYKRDFQESYCRLRDVAFTRSLDPELQTFEEWLAVNKNRIPLG